MERPLETVIQYLIDNDNLSKLGADIDMSNELNLPELSEVNIIRKLNAAFLILLSGKSNPAYPRAKQVFDHFENNTQWKEEIKFYKLGLEYIGKEMDTHQATETDYYTQLNRVKTEINKKINDANLSLLSEINELFFPEGAGLGNKHEREQKIASLREKRKIKIKQLNPNPINDPVNEILFTSNILATVPLDSWNLNALHFDPSIIQKIKKVLEEEQKYWYDHPIPLGIEPEKNEALYGIRGLDNMVEFEKRSGNVQPDDKLTCILSASTTHDGLHDIVKDYFQDEFKKIDQLKNLNIYIFSESDTERIVKQILIPLAEEYYTESDINILNKTFGVDGEYGRHYSFLKAIAAFWQVFIDPQIRATFKIDLDQIFPQAELEEQSGLSALGHFKTPLWGALGVDNNSHDVELGMIAGALVNQSDISKSLFYPDVIFPDNAVLQTDNLIFNSRWPQALSTEAEMMTQYSVNGINGVDEAIQRIHVTGGTNGILINALRTHRPFTPSIIGRAEDQAYLLSVLFKNEPSLRYLHKPGLIMRHDKHAFASEAIAAASTGKLIGDYIRILLFSFYVRVLPWDIKKIKAEIDPFTGCFISELPITVVMLRFVFKVISLIINNDDEEVVNFVKMGSERLNEWIKLLKDGSAFKDLVQNEQTGWELYYNLITLAEEKLKENDPFVLRLQERARKIVTQCKIQY